MTITSAFQSSPSWKDYFLRSKSITYSNLLLEKIRESVKPSRPFISSIIKISKNPGIAFISLDASEENLQLFHHVSVVCRSWINGKETLVGILGSGKEILPIQIIQNSIKEIKGKSFSFDQFADKLKSKMDSNHPLNNDRSAKSDFHNYNILPIPALLTQAFLELEDHSPCNVAVAFFQAMYQFDSKNLQEDNNLFDHDTSFASNSDDVENHSDSENH